MSNIVGNRHSTPEASNSLRPPNQRGTGSGHLLRASADMSSVGTPSPLSGKSLRPSSEVYSNQQGQNGGGEDAADSAAQQWLSDIDQFDNTLEEMAAATVDQDFKDELSAIEQWFKVLTEAERTAALYALLQQTTNVQIRFFMQVLAEMDKNHPLSGVLSPANFGEKDKMSNRMSDATGKLGVAGARESMGRPPASPSIKRNSGLPQETINAMFPAAASAIASKRAEYNQQTGNTPAPNRNSAPLGAGDRTSMAAPSITTPADAVKEGNAASQPAASSWRAKHQSEDKSHAPMGQFAQPPPSAGLRGVRPPALNSNTLHGNTGMQASDMPLMSPAFGGSWASMSNTPMVPNFAQATNQADMVANATAMKLAALSTVNNRVMLDDARKYRRARSNDGSVSNIMPMSPGLPQPGNVLVVNESGQLVNSQLTPQQMATIQMQQQAQAAMLQAQRSRPNSPSLSLRSPAMPQASPMFASPQTNGFLSAYDGSAAGLVAGMQTMGFGSYPMGSGSVSGEELERGRSPRGRRGTSKPPEDPTDLNLLKDIPAWLRMLRLHKYTDQLKDVKWEDLTQMDDAALEKKGVNALGARRKMLKAFEQVREAQAAGKL